MTFPGHGCFDGKLGGVRVLGRGYHGANGKITPLFRLQY